MKTLELKSNIHKIVDQIESESLLKSLYDFLEEKKNHPTERVWDSLTKEQKDELLTAFDESENEQNLIDTNLIFKRK
jgi:hypothetical protein